MRSGKVSITENNRVVWENVRLPEPVDGCVVRSKYSLTPKKLLQKVSQLILVGFSELVNILKVYQSRTP